MKDGRNKQVKFGNEIEAEQIQYYTSTIIDAFLQRNYFSTQLNECQLFIEVQPSGMGWESLLITFETVGIFLTAETVGINGYSTSKRMGYSVDIGIVVDQYWPKTKVLELVEIIDLGVNYSDNPKVLTMIEGLIKKLN